MELTTVDSKLQEKSDLFGKVLRKLRQERTPYRSLRKIAPSIGLSYAQLSNIEKGKNPATERHVGRYLNALHLSWGDFWIEFYKEYPELMPPKK